MEIKEGQVILFKYNDSFFMKLISFGNLIRYGTTGWTHAAIVGEVDKVNGIAWVYEALDKGFTRTEGGYGIEWLKKKHAEGEIEIGETIKPLNNIKGNCEKYLGIPYGWVDIFYCALWVFFGKSSFSFSTGAKELICSEAVARILYDSSNKEIDFVKEFGKSYDIITPMDLKISSQINWLK